MDAFFNPESLVVIGVSPKETNLARYIVENCVRGGFRGRIHAVGPTGGEVEGVAIQETLEPVPDGVALAVILTPAMAVPDILETCGQKGIRHAIIESGGFGELSDEAAGLEDACLDIARRHGMRLMGPNCIGVMNPRAGLATLFGPMESFMPPGGISYGTQSGGMGLHVLLQLHGLNLGLAKFASIGNKLDVDEADLVEYLIQDPETRIILLYLESLSRGRRLMELATQSRKPICVLKSNVSEAGARAAASHTRALSGDDRATDAAFRQSGIVRIRESTDIPMALGAFSLPPMRGNRLAVVSRSGGHACILADAVDRAGFELPPYDEAVFDAASDALRAGVIRLQNPLDTGDIFDFEAYGRIIEAIFRSGQHDGIVFVNTYRNELQRLQSRELMKYLEQLSEEHAVPISSCLVTQPEELPVVRAATRLPVFDSPEAAVEALRLSRDFHGRTPRVLPLARPVDAGDATSAPSRWLAMADALDRLQHYQIPVPVGSIAHSVDQVVSAAGDARVVLKVLSGDVTHKSDLGLVIQDVQGEAAIRRAVGDLRTRLAVQAPEAGIEGILVQEQAPEGLEVIVGGRQDPTLGPLVVFGLGGLFAEVFQDVVIKLAPVDVALARSMIQEVRGARLLRGYRGRPPLDVDALACVIGAVSDLLVQEPEVHEIDLNPVRVYEQGVLALDVRIRGRA